MISTEELTKQYNDFLAVDGVNLQVGAGEVLALLGPNGAGKTTTVRMLTSVLRPTRGTAHVAGFNVVHQPAQVRASVGVLTEQHGLYERMPARDYLDFFGKVYGMEKAVRARRIQNLLEEFGLAQFAARRIGEFSKGMRQKLALARALLHNPPVLLLDEPSSAMDPESARLVRDSLHALRSANRAILICTHNLAEAAELADKIAIIRAGKIIALGSPESLKQSLLGPAQFEACLGVSLNGKLPVLPCGARVSSSGEDWFRFQVERPRENNPTILLSLFEQGFPVISLEEVPRTLEQVYLQAVSAAAGNETVHPHSIAEAAPVISPHEPYAS